MPTRRPKSFSEEPIKDKIIIEASAFDDQVNYNEAISIALKEINDNFITQLSGIGRDVRSIAKISYDEVFIAIAPAVIGIYAGAIGHAQNSGQPYRHHYDIAVNDIEYISGLIYRKLNKESIE